MWSRDCRELLCWGTESALDGRQLHVYKQRRGATCSRQGSPGCGRRLACRNSITPTTIWRRLQSPHGDAQGRCDRREVAHAPHVSAELLRRTAPPRPCWQIASLPVAAGCRTAISYRLGRVLQDRGRYTGNWVSLSLSRPQPVVPPAVGIWCGRLRCRRSSERWRRLVA